MIRAAPALPTRTTALLQGLRGWLAEGSGAVADLGVLVPVASALILKNGLDPGTVLVGAGTLYLAAGLYFRVPVPVQPIKAAAAIAIARHLPVQTIAAAGVGLGTVLVLVGTLGGAAWLTRVFTKPIVRGVQLGVGLILIDAALHLPRGPVAPSLYVLAGLLAALLVVTSRTSGGLPVPLLVVTGGVLISLATASHLPALTPQLWRPHLLSATFQPAVLSSALVLLVIPQLPLTFGNAVVALTDLERKYFAERSRRVNPTAVSFSCGLANLAAGALGGMPMCHGSGGLTAHYRAGARTIRMNLLIGGVLLTMGLFFGPAALALLGLIPIAILVGLLLFTGVLHAWLASDLRGYDLAVAMAMGLVGLLTSNLAISLVLGLLLYWPVRALDLSSTVSQ